MTGIWRLRGQGGRVSGDESCHERSPAMADAAYDATEDQRAMTIDDAQLPVIDLSSLAEGTAEAKASVAAALGEAARTSGFFYVTGHGVPQALVDGVLAAS